MRLVLLFLSVGWLVPLALSIWAAYDFVWRVVWPVAAWKDGENVTTFHFFEWSDELFLVSMAWLAGIIIYWVLGATKRQPA